jgi:hypothetical protein
MPSDFSFQTLAPLTPWLIAVAIVLVVLAFRLYRRSADPAESGSNHLLLGLRLVAIALLIGFLLEPVLSIFNERSVPARVALLLDGSLSMSIPFPEDEGADAAAAESAPTRADRLADTLTGGDDLLGDLRGQGHLEVYRFGGSVTPLPDEAETLDLEPRDDRTDVSRALTEGVGGRRNKTGAVVLMSDGSHNVGVDPRREARRLGVPVFAVGVGNEGPMTDVSVFDVAASNVAYLDNDVPVVAKIRARGDAAEKVPVYLSEGDAVLDSVVVDLPGGGVETEVQLEYVPTKEGLHRYRIWTPAREGEVSASNNEHLFAVRVLKEKIKVLLVGGRLSFDLTFLKRALEDDVSLDVDVVVLSLAKFPGELGERGKELPTEYRDLARYDLLILVDAGAGALEPAWLEDAGRFVSQRGGALMVVGPGRAFDVAGTGLADVLPVVPSRGLRSRSGQILPSLTRSGRTHPVTRLEDDEAVNTRLWEELPPLATAPIFLQRRPGARVLLQGAIDGVPREELPLVATSTSGRGRVLTVAGGPYWRWDLYLWGTGRTGDHFHRFMSRAVRWLVARDELKQVMVRPVKSLFDGAESVVIEGQIFDDDFRPIPGVDVRATIKGPLGTEQEKTREISLVDLGEGRYRGTLPGVAPGDYEIEGTARLGSSSLGGDESEMTVAPYRLEFEDPAPNFGLMRELARESGGRFLTLDDAGDLPGLLKLDPVVDRSVREMSLLENPFLFLLLLVLLGSEWALRRGRGLP